jgi:hypothetical protein
MDDDGLRGWDAYFDDWARRYLSGSDWQRVRWQFPAGTTLAEKVDAAIMDRPPAADSH